MKVSKGTRLLILGAILIVVDQIIKVLVKTNMGLGETVNVLGDWFKLHYVLNEGMISPRTKPACDISSIVARSESQKPFTL